MPKKPKPKKKTRKKPVRRIDDLRDRYDQAVKIDDAEDVAGAQ